MGTYPTQNLISSIESKDGSIEVFLRGVKQIVQEIAFQYKPSGNVNIFYIIILIIITILTIDINIIITH